VTDREAIIRAAERLGLSWPQLAAASGVAYATVHGFLTGTIDPRVSSVEKMLAAVRVAKSHKLPKATGKTPRGRGRPPAER
jgi:predicted transcriptional regulator